MIYVFEVPGKITGKGRPRVNTTTASAYTPAKTKEYEELVKQYFIIKYRRINPKRSLSKEFMGGINHDKKQKTK